jgi:hypothetical protein
MPLNIAYNIKHFVLVSAPLANRETESLMKERKNTSIGFTGDTRKGRRTIFYMLCSKSKKLRKKERISFVKKLRGCQTGKRTIRGKL